MWVIGKVSRRRKGVHCQFARATEGGFPRLSGGVAGGVGAARPSRWACTLSSIKLFAATGGGPGPFNACVVSVARKGERCH